MERRPAAPAPRTSGLPEESRVLDDFCHHYGLQFRDRGLLRLALTHRSYLSVTGQGPRESNERLEFLGDSVLGLVTSEYLYRKHPNEHEGQLTKTKSLLVSKAILSRRALAMGLGKFVLLSHSETESGGRQRLSILADAFESVIGAIYLDQGFEPARAWIERWLLVEANSIVSDKRHTNYKSHLQEYVQSTFRTHPSYRIRSEIGPDHSKHFVVEVVVGKRTLGEGKGHNKKEAEQAAARDALERVEGLRESRRRESRTMLDEPATSRELSSEAAEDLRPRRSRRSEPAEERPTRERPIRERPVRERSVRERPVRDEAPRSASRASAVPPLLPTGEGKFERLAREMAKAEHELEDTDVVVPALAHVEDDEEVGRPDYSHEDLHVDVYEMREDEFDADVEPAREPEWNVDDRIVPETAAELEDDSLDDGSDREPSSGRNQPSAPEAADPPPRESGAGFGRRPGRSRRGR